MFERCLCLLSAHRSRPLHLKLRSLDTSTHTERSHLAPAVCACCTSAPYWIMSSGMCSKVTLVDTHWCYATPCFWPPVLEGLLQVSCSAVSSHSLPSFLQPTHHTHWDLGEKKMDGIRSALPDVVSTVNIVLCHQGIAKRTQKEPGSDLTHLVRS